MKIVDILISALFAMFRAGFCYLDAPGIPQWGRLNNKTVSFENVPSSGTGTAILKFPKLAMTLLKAHLKMAGTAFDYSMITEWRLMIGSKTVTKGTGAHTRLINRYFDRRNRIWEDPNFLTLDFTDVMQKFTAAEVIGGWDLSKMPDGLFKLEVDITGATAPQLECVPEWGPTQDNDVVMRYLRYSGSLGVVSSVGGNSLPLDFQGAEVLRLFAIYAGTDWVGSSATGTGAASNTSGTTASIAVTVAAGAKRGTHTLVVVEPASNAGTFIHYDPDGLVVATGAIGSAYSGGGLSFTLADATDAVSGDRWTIPVGNATEGNLFNMEVKKDGFPIYQRRCLEARYEAEKYGYNPQSKMFVVDFCKDRSLEGRLITMRNATEQVGIEVVASITATDTYNIYAQVLQSASRL